jgi:hypothetical protein
MRCSSSSICGTGLGSLATVGLAIAQIEAVLREAGRPVKF